MRSLEIQPIQTEKFNKPGELLGFIEKAVTGKIKNNDVLTISTKVVSIDENRYFPQSKMTKEELVKQESDHYLGEISYNIFLTIKDGLLIPSAGIDASNSGDENYLLYPKNPFDSAKKIWTHLINKFSLTNLGIILVDSHTTPLRRGTSGIALSYWGFQPVRDYRGKPDLEGKPLQYTYLNLVDGIASAANLCMGEGNECIPLVLVSGAEVEFTNEVNPSDIQIPLEEDLYYPILKDLI